MEPDIHINFGYKSEMIYSTVYQQVLQKKLRKGIHFH